MSEKHYDAVVIGAGMGGMCAAARLAAAGVDVLAVEKTAYLGGRCSHRNRDSAIVTTGAIMIPMAKQSAIREAFDLLGAPMDMIELTGRMMYRLPHGDYDQSSEGGGLRGLIEFAFEGNKDAAQQLFGRFIAALEEIPPDDPTFRDWLVDNTDNDNVIRLFQGFCAALMGTNLHEIPAGEFFRFLKYSSRGSRFGMARKGNGELMETLAAAIEARGGTLRRKTQCRKILTQDNAVTGAVLSSREHGEEIVHCDFVLSNTGPDRTVELVGGRELFDAAYLELLDASPHEAPIFHISFLTDEPLIEDFDGCLVFGNNENLIYLEIPSLISPDVSPSGKYLHTAYGAPSDAANANLTEELENTLAELRENFPGKLDSAEFLVKARHSGQSPGMHRWAGHMLPVTTSIRNLYNVGDGSTSPGTIGTEGAASSAREAVELILSGQAPGK
ncbi:MAG: FAD-dependent oxidoreductase [Gammaproteobacteria bacterium]|nr:FAD-dependent oxidoreductase [Gammaproteobacteria bacterium]